jgi:hypothetical protein
VFTALLAAAMTAVTILPQIPAGAAVDDQPAAAASAAAWIATELDKAEPSFDVFGQASARNDVIYALASTGGEEGAARQALAELGTGASDYIDTSGIGGLAKVLLSVEVAGGDPAAFLPGRDLEAELRGAMTPEGAFGADVFTQSLAMIALGATAGGVPPAAIAALEDVQCAEGGFTFAGDCSDEVAVPDVDATAVATQALLAGSSSVVAGEAAAWLVSAQNADGSWPNAFGDPNANSAGVAGQALRAAGETAAANAAADFVMSLQTADGGIKFTAAAEEADGFATLQGILALGGPAYSELHSVAFADVADDSLFSGEIAWLGLAEISKGCDPPANDNFCPDDNVTRGQMAAFLVRALHLTDTGGTDFTDDDGSVFEADIAKLAAADITRGCNPPTNDQFCPDDNVNRGQMAAFLFRALEG